MSATGEQAVAQARVALCRLEEAQHLLELAAQDLCSIVGLAADWKRVSNLRDQVQAEWHRLNENIEIRREAGGLRFDKEPK